MSRYTAWQLAQRAHRRDVNDVAILRRIADAVGSGEPSPDFVRRMIRRAADRLEKLGDRALEDAKREGRGP
jgi:archaellum biogenesis protein FlaJ (TadC family)